MINNSKFEIKPSPIHGLGLFALDKFNVGEILFIAFINTRSDTKQFDLDFKQTPINSYCNHSLKPNTKLIFHKPTKSFGKVAITTINKGDEITGNYYKLMEYIKSQGFILNSNWMWFERYSWALTRLNYFN